MAQYFTKGRMNVLSVQSSNGLIPVLIMMHLKQDSFEIGSESIPSHSQAFSFEIKAVSQLISLCETAIGKEMAIRLQQKHGYYIRFN